MHIGSTGDLSQSYSMQSRNSAIKQDIQRLTLELSSGRVADVREAVGGSTAYLNDLEASLAKLDGYDLATREATQFASGVQTALSRMSDLNSAFRDTLLTSAHATPGKTSTGLITEAKSAFGDLIGAMNTSVAGRMIFAGTATDVAPIAPADDILAAVGAALAGAATVDDMLTAAQTWFDDPAGFGAVGYLGSDKSLAPFNLSDTQNTTFGLRGDDPVLRDMLRHTAMVALADDPALGLSLEVQNELIRKSIPAVLETNDAITGLQAQAGFFEGRIEAVTVRNSAQRTALEIARNDLLSIDPYETATELEQVQFQLQSLYAITSRMSQLSLVNFL